MIRPDDLFRFTPKPEEPLDWDALNAEYDWIRVMRDCPQDPEFHAEGDVWIHTRMVIEQMLLIDPPERELLFAAAVLHDVGKPACTKLEEGRWRSRGHSMRGAIMARRILWEMGVPFGIREHICGLIRFHQLPYYLFERPDPLKMAYRISQSARCDWLTTLALADIRGRVCADQQRSLDHIALFAEYCREQGIESGPKQFASDHSRFEYFRRDDRDPEYAAYDDCGFEVTLLSGLPGSGKDTWLARHAPELPVISLDEIREETGAAPTGDQGPVIAEAKERARVLLRRKQPFALNATNLNREFRSRWIQLFTDYRARIRIVYLESPASRLWDQNRNRTRIVPEEAIVRMMERWEIPDRTEAHCVEYEVA
jgi:predicted kinase